MRNLLPGESRFWDEQAHDPVKTEEFVQLVLISSYLVALRMIQVTAKFMGARFGPFDAIL